MRTKEKDAKNSGPFEMVRTVCLLEKLARYSHSEKGSADLAITAVRLRIRLARKLFNAILELFYLIIKLNTISHLLVPNFQPIPLIDSLAYPIAILFIPALPETS